jgi:RNA polymerase sigma-70 factor (ECF subfamily)
VATNCTDEELMGCVAEQNRDAFDELDHRYRSYIANFVRSKLHSNEHVDDVVQEVFLRVYRSAASFDRQRKLRKWLFVIAMNEVRRAWTRSSHTALSLSYTVGEDESLELESLLADNSPGPQEITEHKLEAKQLRQAMELLPETQREALLLRTYVEMSLKEIAERMHCPVSTVNSRLHHAMEKLRLMLSGSEAA